MRRRMSLNRLSSLQSIPSYQGDDFGTRGNYDSGMHYAYRAQLRSPPISPPGAAGMSLATTPGAPAGSASPTVASGGDSAFPFDETMSTPPTANPAGAQRGLGADAKLLVEESLRDSSGALDDCSPCGEEETDPSSSRARAGMTRPSLPGSAMTSSRKPPPPKRRGRAASTEAALSDFLAAGGLEMLKQRTSRASSPELEDSELPQRLPEVPAYTKKETMSVQDFVSRNSGFDEFLLGPHPEDGARYVAQALGIREILSNNFSADSAPESKSGLLTPERKSRSTSPSKPAKSPAHRSNFAKLPPLSPVLVRAQLAARLPKSSTKRDLYWKPLAKQDRTPLLLAPEPPPAEPDPFELALRRDPPDIRRLKRGLARANPHLDVLGLSERRLPSRPMTTSFAIGKRSEFRSSAPATAFPGSRRRAGRSQIRRRGRSHDPTAPRAESGPTRLVAERVESQVEATWHSPQGRAIESFAALFEDAEPIPEPDRIGQARQVRAAQRPSTGPGASYRRTAFASQGSSPAAPPRGLSSPGERLPRIASPVRVRSGPARPGVPSLDGDVGAQAFGPGQGRLPSSQADKAEKQRKRGLPTLEHVYGTSDVLMTWG